LCIQRGDHRMPYLCKSFATNEPYIQLRIWEKESCKITHSMPLHTPTNFLGYLVPMTDFLRDWDQQITSQSKIMHPMPPRAPRLPEFPYRFGANSRSPLRVGSTDLLCEWDQGIKRVDQQSLMSSTLSNGSTELKLFWSTLSFNSVDPWIRVDDIKLCRSTLLIRWSHSQRRSVDPTRKEDRELGPDRSVDVLCWCWSVDPTRKGSTDVIKIQHRASQLAVPPCIAFFFSIHSARGFCITMCDDKPTGGGGMEYRVAKTHRIPSVAGHFLQKSH